MATKLATKSRKKTQKKQAKVSAPRKRKIAAQKGKTVSSRLKPLIDDIPTNDYDKLFEQKLADQYKMFRSLKENHVQTKRFIRILIVLLVIILLAILLISFSS